MTATKEQKQAQDRRRYERHTERIKARSRSTYAATRGQVRAKQLLRLYGITPEEYDQMYEDQGGRCGICNSPEAECSRKRLFVDHDHETSRVRGLLCHKCNTGLAMLGDSESAVHAADMYLRGVR